MFNHLVLLKQIVLKVCIKLIGKWSVWVLEALHPFKSKMNSTKFSMDNFYQD